MKNIIKPFSHIVVFMPRFLGDCINCTPALKLLETSYPKAKITLVIRSIPSQAFNRDEKFQLIIDERPKNKVQGMIALIKSLKNESFDAGILMTNTLIDAVLARISGVKNLIGYNKEMRKPLLTKALHLDIRRHYINRYAYITNALCENSHKNLPEVDLFYDTTQSVLADINKTKIGFCIVNKAKLSRHYPVRHAAEVINLLNQQLQKPTSFYMLGAPDETVEAEQVVSLCQEKGAVNIHSLAGKTTIAQLIDTIADLDLLITVDSGPLHVAAATKTTTIALQSKGTSPFSNVCPKGKQVTVINNAGNYINDDDQILDISPKLIAKIAIELIKNKNSFSTT
jgi:heptosyltransferase-2